MNEIVNLSETVGGFTKTLPDSYNAGAEYWTSQNKRKVYVAEETWLKIQFSETYVEDNHEDSLGTGVGCEEAVDVVFAFTFWILQKKIHLRSPIEF